MYKCDVTTPQVDGGEIRLIYTLRRLAEIDSDNDRLFSLTELFLQLRPDDVPSGSLWLTNIQRMASKIYLVALLEGCIRKKKCPYVEQIWEWSMTILS